MGMCGICLSMTTHAETAGIEQSSCLSDRADWHVFVLILVTDHVTWYFYSLCVHCHIKQHAKLTAWQRWRCRHADILCLWAYMPASCTYGHAIPVAWSLSSDVPG